ncbi:MAG TPA: hypothetical protein PKH41_02650, partial [Macellibacteroides fermentans]|nr:hypothetical protein [Macellibacteroides fermentans]
SCCQAFTQCITSGLQSASDKAICWRKTFSCRMKGVEASVSSPASPSATMPGRLQVWRSSSICWWGSLMYHGCMPAE